MKRWLRALAHALLGDYKLFHIFRMGPGADGDPEPPENGPWRFDPVHDMSELRQAIAPSIRAFAESTWDGCYAFAARADDRLAGIAFFKSRQGYQRGRMLWSLKQGDVELVQLTTEETYRGRGLAPLLIRWSSAQMVRLGFAGIYAKVWHNYRPSLRAFRKAGWQKVAFLVELYPFGTCKRIRLVIPRKHLRAFCGDAAKTASQ